MRDLVLENVAVNAQASALARLADGGFLRLKSAGGATLAEMRFASPAFASPVAGLIVANGIRGEASAPNAGTAVRYAVYSRDGETLLWSGTVGKSDADCLLNNVEIQAGAQVTIGSFTHQVPRKG